MDAHPLIITPSARTSCMGAPHLTCTDTFPLAWTHAHSHGHMPTCMDTCPLAWTHAHSHGHMTTHTHHIHHIHTHLHVPTQICLIPLHGCPPSCLSHPLP